MHSLSMYRKYDKFSSEKAVSGALWIILGGGGGGSRNTMYVIRN